MKAKILIDDLHRRFKKGEIGEILKNDSNKYDYFLRLPSKQKSLLFPLKYKLSTIEADRKFYFYKNEIEIIKENEISTEEQEKILKHLDFQLREIRKSVTLKVFKNIRITCYDCKRDSSILYMFRCYKCGLWICSRCASKHFNIDKSKLLKYIK